MPLTVEKIMNKVLNIHGSLIFKFFTVQKVKPLYDHLLTHSAILTTYHDILFGIFNRECVTKFGDNIGMQIWEAVNECFDCMPIAATVDDKVSFIIFQLLVFKLHIIAKNLEKS